MRKARSWFTLNRLPTVTGQVAIRHGRGTLTSCCGTPLLHISRTQSTIALSSAEAELDAMGQATIEAQHFKQVIEEMNIPNLSQHVTMSINTASSAGKAVASRLGLYKKTKHFQLRYLHMQDIVQCGDMSHMTITKIPTTHNPADILTKHLPATTINSHLDRLCLQTTSTVGSLLGVPTTTRLTIGIIHINNNEQQTPAAEARALTLTQVQQHKRR
eukprot:447915-Amphidinium_carterae.2